MFLSWIIFSPIFLLLVPQCHRGIQGSRSPRRHNTGDHRHEHQDCRRSQQRQRITRTASGPCSDDAAQTNAEPEPNEQSRREHESSRTNHQPQDVGAGRTKGHPDTNFLSTLRYGKRDNAVQPNRGEGKREDCEQREQSCNESSLSPRLSFQPPVQRMIVVHYYVAVEFVQSLFHQQYGGFRITVGTHKQLLIRRQNKTVRKKNRRLCRVIEAVVAYVSNHANHFQPIIRRLCKKKIRALDLEHRTPNHLTYGFTLACILLHEGLVDHGQMGSATNFCVVENPACKEWHLEGREFLWAHQGQDRLGSSQRRLAANLNLGAESSEGRKPRGRNAGTGNTRHLSNCLTHPLLTIQAGLPVWISAFGRDNI